MRSLLFSAFALLVTFVPGAALAAEPDALSNLDTPTIQYFAAKGILEGSLDGSLYLAKDITRAEFTKAVVEYVYPEWAISTECLRKLDTDTFPGVSYTLLFNDVPKDAPYALHLCAAMRGGMIWGYGDGNFRPNDTINLAEASKVISVAFGLGYKMPEYQTDDWYVNYLQTLRRYTVFPETVTSPNHVMKIGETRTILENVSARMAATHGSRVNGKLDAAIMSSVKVQALSTSTVQRL